MVKRIYALLILTLLSTAVLADLTATVDRNVVTDGEVVNYILRSDGQTFSSSPNLSPLEKDFNILNTRQSSQIRMINGRSESWVEWNIALLPKKVGAVTIPPIEHNGHTSNPITIDVRKAAATPQGAPASSPVYMRSSIGHQEVWQNQETILTLKIFVRAQFADSPNLTPPDTEGAIFKVLGEDQNQERIIDGIRYQVITRQYVVTPTHPGTLTIPGQVLTGSIMEEDPYGGRSLLRMTRSKPFRVTSPAMELTVKSVPANWPSGKPWLPAEDVSISESWSESLNELKAGDSITRTVMITARGSNSAQIPPLPTLDIAGMRSYPDQPRLDDKRDSKGAIGTRSESVAIVPTRRGEFSIPAIEVTWFNTRTAQVEVSRLEGQTIHIKTGVVEAEASRPVPVLTPANPEKSSMPEAVSNSYPIVAGNQRSLLYWQIATFVFGGLWLITFFAWLRKRPSRKVIHQGEDNLQQSDTSEKIAFQTLLKDCADDNFSAVEISVLNWGRLFLSSPESYSASTIIEQMGNSELSEEWSRLQRHRYQKGSAAHLTTTQLGPLFEAIRRSSNDLEKSSMSYTTINP